MGNRKTVEAIADWLIASKRASKLKQPLFTVIAYNGNSKRLTGEAIRRLVDGLCKKVGITKQMSPHRIRHSSITTVLDKNNGNYRATQRFSRHAKPDTVMKYDDNRQKLHSSDDRYIGRFGLVPVETSECRTHRGCDLRSATESQCDRKLFCIIKYFI